MGCVLALITPLLLAPPLLAQGTGSVEGRVRSVTDGAPLADVMIRVDESLRGTLTDSTGRYRLSALAPGAHRIAAQRVGLEPDTQTVTVAAGATARADFSLKDAALMLAPTVVTASRERESRTDAAVTIDVVGGPQVRESNATHPSEIMNRMPGVHVNRTSGEGHMMSIRQPITTKPVYLYLEDGVPTRATGFFNHNALYEIDLPQSDGIEVIKGPGTALYGSDAIGGVINVLTQAPPARPVFEAKGEGGAYGYGRLLLSGGTTAGDNGVRGDLNLTRTDGWRDAAGYTRESGVVRWDHGNVGGWTAKTVLTGTHVRQNDVFTLDAAHFAERSALNRAPISFRMAQAFRLHSAIEKESGSSSWSFTPYARYDVLELLPEWQLSYDPQRYTTRNSSAGLLAKYRHDFVPWNTRLIVGADGDWSPGHFLARQVVTSTVGPNRIYQSYTLGDRQYDYDVTYRSISPYAQLQFSPLPRVRLSAGVRYDVAGYDYHTHLPPDESPTSRHKRPPDAIITYDDLSPKLGITLDVAPGVNVYASYRHGFRAPSQNQLFRQNTALNTVGLRPVNVDSYETGVRGAVGRHVLYELSVYDMTITDDILTFITAQNTREAVNSGESRYKGIEGGLGVAFTPRLRLDASYSVASQRYVHYVPQAARPAHDSVAAVPAVDYSGNRVEQAPRDLASAIVTFSPRLLRGGHLSVEYSQTGHYATDAANTHSYGGYSLVTVQGSYAVTPQAELFAHVTNVMDRTYSELASYDPFQGSQFTPGSPRSVYLGVHYTWER